MPRLAIDFGTSNTAAAIMAGPQPWKIPLEPGETTMPTAMFFDPYSDTVVYGHRAVAALIDGREGRFLRALKSVLGTPLLRERRLLGGKRTTLLQVIGQFLARVKAQAEDHCHMSFDSALSGRPVHFHSRNPDYDAQAATDLAECYALAGFRDVSFLAEPEAAALACGGVDSGLGLVVDIGGGTSDFTVFRGQGDDIETLASHGIRLGGTDFDRLLNIDRVMPLLGMGSKLRRAFGDGTTEAPKALFNELATWEKIPFQYTPETRRAVADMARLAIEPRPWDRLAEVLESELAHDIAHAVEQAKIAANSGTAHGVALDPVEPGLRATLDRADLVRQLDASTQEIGDAATTALSRAGVSADQISRVVLVGGSSLLAPVDAAVRSRFAQATIDRSDAFTAIVDGLAIAAARQDAIA